MKPLVIKIHSFIDVITNSSTEIYVRAGDHTVVAAKELVESILRAGVSNKTCDDLFRVELAGETLVVTPIANDNDSVAAALALSSLRHMFSIDAEYNG